MKTNPLEPELQKLMRDAFPPTDARLERDLWPRMEARLAAGARRRERIRLKWWEWALAAGDLGAAMYAPEAIPALLYHL